MQSQIIEKILESLKTNIKDKGSFIQFNRPGYTPAKISKENFREIPSITSEKKLCFIDGGNQEILGSSNFSLQLIRTYFTIYQNNKRIRSGSSEFYALITAHNKEDKIIYKIEVFSEMIKNFEIDSLDPDITEGKKRAEISKIGNIARNIAEIKTIGVSTQHLSENDIIVRDGNLEANSKIEFNELENIYNILLKKNIILAALSKTSALFTDTGNSVNALLRSIAPDNPWYYNNIVKVNNKDHQADIFFIKLNKNTDYIFRFEIFQKNTYNIDEILSLLKANSTDPIFIGYPYGLIEADRFARITNQEVEYARTTFTVKAGSDFNMIKQYLAAKNAHSILDNIS